jgi:hypothetical protein
MNSRLPAINDLVMLRLAGEDACHSIRVEGLKDGGVVVKAPTLVGDDIALLSEALFELEWSSERGLLTAPVRWIGNHREDRSLWQLEICGEITTSQRRRFVRAPLSLPCWLHVGTSNRAGVPGPNTGTSVEGTLLDLSEAGVRLVLPHGSRHARALRTGFKVIVEMTLADETLLLPGEVHSALPIVPPGGETLCIVVILDDPGPVATLLRKIVLQLQIEARKAWA